MEQFLENVTAAEMLHHLFPPLAFLVDECFDYFDEDFLLPETELGLEIGRGCIFKCTFCFKILRNFTVWRMK